MTDEVADVLNSMTDQGVGFHVPGNTPYEQEAIVLQSLIRVDRSFDAAKKDKAAVELLFDVAERGLEEAGSGIKDPILYKAIEHATMIAKAMKLKTVP